MEILLVDDDAGSLKGMQIALLMLKHNCDAYIDPYEAIKNYPKRTYDLVITDIYMPSINGFTLAQTLRDINPKTKIIFMSGQAIESVDDKINAGAECCFLRKPIDFNQLRQVLDQLAGDFA